MEKRYDHKICEQQAQKKWNVEHTYAQANNPGPTYSIDTPPPTVSGSLHIGHIFSYTQTDIIARYKRMSGCSVFYPFGFDNNGLPTERYIEKKCKVSAHQLGRTEFTNLCLKETSAIQEQFKELWQKMGLSVDWELSYSTISESVRKISQKSFATLYKKGFIYRAHEPALYCTTCRTSVAQAELDDVDHDSTFNDIIFKDENGNDLIIGTTRPELLPSCVALLYNPKDPRYTHLKDTHARVPLFDFTVPVYPDENVAIDKGTGLVMCCTFGDKMDIAWFKKFNLPYKQSIGFDGKFMQYCGILAGLKVPLARQTVLDALREQGLLVKQEVISHAVNVHERCQKEIEYVALEQWFLRILDYKKELLDLADTISWNPTFMKARYKDWVENIGWDWCLSRQRIYGIPFPAYHCQDCKEIIIADLEQLPVDPQETAYNKPCPKCAGINIKPDTDIMDTWNTSSITPYILARLADPTAPSPAVTEEKPAFFPMGMRPQAHDIIRTWAFYTMIKSWMHHKTAPWEEIVISGHVLSDKNQKLSKSKNNASLEPNKLLEQYPADAIRYWTASGKLGHDIAFSPAQLKVGQRLITKMWNAFRFTAEHIATAPDTNPESSLGMINEWILHKASSCFAQYKEQFKNHEIGAALATVEPFFWNDFCDNYLELIKNQLFNPEEYDVQTIAATRWTLHHIGLRILQLYAPYLPHITETLYEIVYKNQIKALSLHQTNFAQAQQEYRFDESVATAEKIIELVAQVRKLKTTQQLSLKIPLATLTISTDQQLADVLQNQEALLYGITHAQKIAYSTTHVAENSIKEIDGLWHATITL